MDALLNRLLSQAYLFEDPRAYAAGVRDAYELLVLQRVEDEVA